MPGWNGMLTSVRLGIVVCFLVAMLAGVDRRWYVELAAFVVVGGLILVERSWAARRPPRSRSSWVTLAPADGVTGTVRFIRDAGYRDSLRRYAVVVDGLKAARLGPHEMLDLVIAPGQHWVRLRVDWSGSRKVRTTVGPDEVVTIRVVDQGALMAFFDAFSLTRYIQVEVSGGDSRTGAPDDAGTVWAQR